MSLPEGKVGLVGYGGSKASCQSASYNIWRETTAVFIEANTDKKADRAGLSKADDYSELPDGFVLVTKLNIQVPDLLFIAGLQK